jgi:hypothetical protein
MPWSIVEGHPDCQGGFAVVKDDDGEVEGCHMTRPAAEAQLAALYASEDDGEAPHGMVAAVPGDAASLAVEGGEEADELHVTLRYFEGELDPLDLRALRLGVGGLAGRRAPFDARVAGAGTLGDEGAVVLFLEAEELNELRDAVEEEVGGLLAGDGFPNFIPHLTLGYDIDGIDELAERFAGTTVRIEGLRAAYDGDDDRYPLGGSTMSTNDAGDAGEDAGGDPAAEARARVAPVHAAPRPVEVRRDLRALPDEVRERLAGAGADVGVVDRVGRGLFELRFRPEWRLNEDGTVDLHGYACVYDFAYDVLGGAESGVGWSETVDGGACARSVAERDDVRFLVNHEGVPLARTKSGTMSLASDEIGLYMHTPRLDPRSPDVASLASALERGDVDEMSFAFRTLRDTWNEDWTARNIHEVMLYDVSAVTYPANPATVIKLREAVLAVEAAADAVAAAVVAADGGNMSVLQAQALLGDLPRR